LEEHLKNIAVTEERLQRLQELQEFRTSQGLQNLVSDFGSEKLLQERMPRRHTHLRVPTKTKVECGAGSVCVLAFFFLFSFLANFLKNMSK